MGSNKLFITKKVFQNYTKNVRMGWKPEKYYKNPQYTNEVLHSCILRF